MLEVVWRVYVLWLYSGEANQRQQYKPLCMQPWAAPKAKVKGNAVWAVDACGVCAWGWWGFISMGGSTCVFRCAPLCSNNACLLAQISDVTDQVVAAVVGSRLAAAAGSWSGSNCWAAV